MYCTTTLDTAGETVFTDFGPNGWTFGTKYNMSEQSNPKGET